MQEPTIKPTNAERGQKTTLIGIAINFALVIIKASAGVWGNSYALVADALEAATDIVTSTFVWLGLRVAARKPDENHSYGHGKAEPLAVILVSFALVGAAILIAVQSV